MSRVEFNDQPALISQAANMGSFFWYASHTSFIWLIFRLARLVRNRPIVGIAEPILASELPNLLLKYAPNVQAAIVKESP